jgi:predicted MPP superfamily phosphohydrolase
MGLTGLAAGLSAAFLAAGLCQDLKLTEYHLSSIKLRSGVCVRLLLLSDLHGKRWGIGQRRLLALAHRAAPDAVFMAGDMTDAGGDPEAALELARAFASDIPVCFVTGNHDLPAGDRTDLYRLMRKAGVTVLSNETVTIDIGKERLRVSGLCDPGTYERLNREHPKQTYLQCLDGLKPLDSRYFNLLVAHRPEYIDAYEQAGFDLALCGHTHGGVIRLPRPLNGLYASGQGLFPKYAAGLIGRNTLTAVISRGLHAGPLRPRFFNRPEAVLVCVSGVINRIPSPSR